MRLQGVQVPNRDFACTCAREAAVLQDGKWAATATLRVHGVHVREAFRDLPGWLCRERERLDATVIREEDQLARFVRRDVAGDT